jgi:hypothetical protein
MNIEYVFWHPVSGHHLHAKDEDGIVVSLNIAGVKGDEGVSAALVQAGIDCVPLIKEERRRKTVIETLAMTERYADEVFKDAKEKSDFIDSMAEATASKKESATVEIGGLVLPGEM